MLELAPVLVRDLEDRIVLWTRGLERFYGYSKEEALESISHVLLRTQFPQSLAHIKATLFQTGVWEGELIRYRRDGTQVSVSSQWVLHRDHQGRPIRVVETNTDVTNLKAAEAHVRQLNQQLEQQVHERTVELEAANNELEAFTYSVSHDFRAPIRHISGFAQMLSEEAGQGLSDEAQRLLSRIQDGARRMGMLVDDLVNLARIGRHQVQLQVTGLGPVVKDCIADLAPDLEGRSVEWKIGELPFVEADPTLLKQVFHNLLSNALKYTRPRSPARIEIGTMEQDGERAIFVRDNGVGFNMKYADKLFGVFQRLHREENLEGTGVGLAAVRRIVQKHGGRIWAEAELDRGATFLFTLAPGKKGARAMAAKEEV